MTYLQMIELIAIGGAVLAALAAVFAALAWMAAAGGTAKLLIATDKVLAGQRAEAEFGRAQVAATEGRVVAAIATGTTGALTQAFEKISVATEAVARAVDTLKRQAAEDSGKTLAMLEGRLAEIQTSVNEKLHEAVETQMTNSFSRVLEQFAQVQTAMADVQSAAAQIGDLKRLFSNVKTRGGWGEAQLGAMLENVLPPGAFERNFAISEGRERVDFAIRMPGRERLWLPVDAKFPTEDYDRLVVAAETGTAEEERAARDNLSGRVRLEARKIREKYVAPPVTVDFGVMYLPSDGLFAEVARIPNLIDELRVREKVIVLGPTLLPAMLQTIHLGHITLDLEQRAGEIGRLLGATKTEMAKMDDVLGKLANNASAMSNNIERARVRTRKVQKVLQTVEFVGVPEAQAMLGVADEADEAGAF
jgi:DNA recombination protein RmuC